MGIRIFCPNGHKLNVKAFLAGKTGICPHCGSKFEIPANAVEDAAPIATAAAGAQPLAAQPVVQPGAQPVAHPVAQAVAPQPVAARTVAAPVAPVYQAARPVNPAEYAAPVAAPAIAPVAAAQPGDPLLEAPTANWYLRPAAGGQYGPATPDVMRQWLDEGRVGPDSYVWREGWPDWKMASGVFPVLGAAASVAVAAQPVGGVLDWAQPELPRRVKRTPRKKSMSPAKLIAIIMIVLVTLLGGLVAALVLNQKGKEEERKPTPPPAVTEPETPAEPTEPDPMAKPESTLGL